MTALTVNPPDSSFVSGHLAAVRQDLDAVNDWIGECLKDPDPDLSSFLTPEHARGGKRVRAAFLLLSGKACGGIGPEQIAVAGILEMVHAATLIHDDILDGAGDRRGVPVAHVTWGTQAAILLGDWIYSKAFLESTRLKNPACSEFLAEATLETCRGEIRQDLAKENFSLPMSSYLRAAGEKTATLFKAAGFLGAEYAKEESGFGELLGSFGWNAGLAFQLQDDLIDVKGVLGETGKTLGTDWASGKMTYPLICLRDSLSAEKRDLMEAMFLDTSSVTALENAFSEEWASACEATEVEVNRLLGDAITFTEGIKGQRGVEEIIALALWTAGRRS